MPLTTCLDPVQQVSWIILSYGEVLRETQVEKLGAGVGSWRWLPPIEGEQFGPLRQGANGGGGGSLTTQAHSLVSSGPNIFLSLK